MLDWIKDKRSKKIYWNIKVSLLCKIVIAFITFVQVPIVLKCLGEYTNGIWLTISSLLLWIDVMDIGLGNGLRNRLAEAMATNNTEYAKKIISSTFAMLIGIIIPVLCVLLICISVFDMYDFFNVNRSVVDHFDTALVVAVSMVCCTFIFKFIGNVYMGLQLPSISNVFQALGLLVGLILTYILYVCHAGTLLNIVAVNTVAPLAVYLAAYPITFYIKYPQIAPSLSCVRKKQIHDLFDISISFFLIQVGSLFLFASSNILISKFYDPAEVTPFQIGYRYMSLMITAFTIIAMPMWNATTDAYSLGDWKWIKDADRKMTRITFVFIACYIVMVGCSSLFYSVWVGNDVDVPLNYTITIGLYVLIVICSTRYSYFLNGVGALRLQVYTTIVDAIAFIALARIITLFSVDMEYFIILMCLTQLPGLIVNRIQFSKILNHKANGIWSIR